MTMEFKGKRAKLYNNLEWATVASFIDPIVDCGRFRSTDIVLDVGTGTGIMTRAIAPLVRKIVGLDVSRDMLSLSLPYPNVTLVVKDIRNSGLRSKTFDRIVARQVFHHILKDTQQAASECYRLLRPGGLMILAEGVPPTREVEPHYRKVFRLKEDRVIFTEGDLVTLMRRSGFTDVTLLCIWQRQISIRNWLANSGLPKKTQTEIYALYPAAQALCERTYNMTMHDDDCFIDMKHAIITGRKGK